MGDAARLHLFSTDPERTARDVLRQWAWTSEGDELHPRAQLVLAHAWSVSAYPRRREQLAGLRRASIYEKQVRRQIDRITQLLAVD